MVKFKVIFDKDTNDNNYYSGWGISYLLNGKILFDAGEKTEYTIGNLKKMGIDIGKIEKIVISHNHWDHIGGLWDLLAVNNNITVFACSDFFDEFKDKIKDYNFRLVEKSEEIAKDIYTTGCLSTNYKGSELKEQALVIKSEKGISLVCGCSHPGILKLIGEAKKIFPQENIYALLGGFHLIDKDNRIIKYTVDKVKESGVVKVGPSHCTGYEAVDFFRRVYPNDTFNMIVGDEFSL